MLAHTPMSVSSVRILGDLSFIKEKRHTQKSFTTRAPLSKSSTSKKTSTLLICSLTSFRTGPSLNPKKSTPLLHKSPLWKYNLKLTPFPNSQDGISQEVSARLWSQLYRTLAATAHLDSQERLHSPAPCNSTIKINRKNPSYMIRYVFHANRDLLSAR